MAGINYEVLTDATIEPIALTDMKTYLRVDYTDEDSLITQFITDARHYAQDLTKRALASQTIRATIEPYRLASGDLSGPVVGEDLDPFRYSERISAVPFGFYGPCFQLPHAPGGLNNNTSVTKVEYQLTPFDIVYADNTEEYQWTLVAPTDGNGNAQYRLDTNTDPAQLFIMPMLIAERFRITYTTGYATVPNRILNNMKRLIAFWYDNRDGEPIPDDIENEFIKMRIFEL